MPKVNGNIQKDTVSSEINGLFGSLGSKNLGLSETGGVSTGWISGGVMSALGDAAPDITAGVGYIYNSTADTYTRVAWNAVNNLSVTNNAVNYISVNSSGVVSATTTVPGHEEQRTAIQLGRVSMTSGVITAITPTVVSIKQVAPQIYDIFQAYGTAKKGLTISAASTNLKLSIASGEIYAQGVSAQTNPNNPNEALFTANNPQTFRMFTQTAVSGGDVTDLPVGSYDNAGTVTAIPGAGSQATIFTVYKFSSGNVRVFYGQTIYTNLSTAVASIGSYNPVVPAAFADAIVLGYIAATKNATNLSQPTQAVFINTNRFGGVGGAVASAGGFMFTDFSNASGVLPIANGGTGSSTQNFVDLSTSQTVGGVKTFQNAAGASNYATIVKNTSTNGYGLWVQGGTLNQQDIALGVSSNSGEAPQFRVTSSGYVYGGIFSIGTNSASDGYLRMPNGISTSQGIGFRNAANTADFKFGLNSSNQFQFGTDIVSPSLVGTPTAPTASPGTNTTQLATTAFVTNAVSGITASPFTRNTGTGVISPVTSTDVLQMSGTGTTNPVISITATGSSGQAIIGIASGSSGVAVRGDGSSNANGGLFSTGSASLAAIRTGNTSSGPIHQWYNSSSDQSSILNNGGFNWVNATATTTAGWDASKNLVSITNTGTGNAVRATSPTLVTPNIGDATGSDLTLIGSTSNPLTVQSDAGGNVFNFSRSNGSNASIFLGGGSAAGSIYALGVNGTTAMQINASGVTTINTLGSGSVVATAGTLSVTSDSRLKTLAGTFKGSALNAIGKLPLPEYWRYNAKSGMPDEARKVRQFGLLADKVHGVLGEEFAPTGKDGYHGMNDRAIIGLLVQAVQELKKEVETLKSQIK